MLLYNVYAKQTNPVAFQKSTQCEIKCPIMQMPMRIPVVVDEHVYSDTREDLMHS